METDSTAPAQGHESHSLMPTEETIAFWGSPGRSAFYRYVRQGLIPKPVRIGHLVRFVRGEQEAARARAIEKRELVA